MSEFRVVLISQSEEDQDWTDVVVEADSEAEAKTAAEDSYPGFKADGVWANE